jgi:hypothetical protein
VTYYNHKRPHQGIGGLCPADRFFEIAHELKKTLEQGMEENVLEMALRGKPRDPFYMVGRMGEQSVVIRAEKGKVKMLVDGEEHGQGKELVYDVKNEDSSHERQGKDPGVFQPAGQDEDRAADVDTAALQYGRMPQDVCPETTVEKHPAAVNQEHNLMVEHQYGKESEGEDTGESVAGESGLAASSDYHEGAVRTDDGD